MTTDHESQSFMDFEAWLTRNRELVATRWYAEIRSRAGNDTDPENRLLFHLIETLTLLLPHCLGDGRDSGAPLWEQASDLYGALALQRSLASGEVVEEVQQLRSVIFRLLLESPPEGGLTRALQKDFLSLNRLLDVAVVRATIAYTDELFFAHLQGSGVPEGLTQDVEEEMRSRLASLRRRMDQPW